MTSYLGELRRAYWNNAVFRKISATLTASRYERSRMQCHDKVIAWKHDPRTITVSSSLISVDVFLIATRKKNSSWIKLANTIIIPSRTKATWINVACVTKPAFHKMVVWTEPTYDADLIADYNTSKYSVSKRCPMSITHLQGNVLPHHCVFHFSFKSTLIRTHG